MLGTHGLAGFFAHCNFGIDVSMCVLWRYHYKLPYVLCPFLFVCSFLFFIATFLIKMKHICHVKRYSYLYFKTSNFKNVKLQLRDA